MLSALMLSISSIYSKKVTRNKDASIVTGYQLFIGGTILIVLGLIFGGHLTGFTIKSSLLFSIHGINIFSSLCYMDTTFKI